MTYSIVARDPETGRFGSRGPVPLPGGRPGGAVAGGGRRCDRHPGIGRICLRADWPRAAARPARAPSRRWPPCWPAMRTRRSGSWAWSTRRAARRRTPAARPSPPPATSCATASPCRATCCSNDTCWPAMAAAYEAGLAEGVPFVERLLRAMEAAEAEGGDVRGRQSAAIIVVDAQLQPRLALARAAAGHADRGPPRPGARAAADRDPAARLRPARRRG